MLLKKQFFNFFHFNFLIKNTKKLLKIFIIIFNYCIIIFLSAGNRELAEFLEAEIAAEKELHKKTTIPSKIGSFSVSLDGANVTLKKHEGDES